MSGDPYLLFGRLCVRFNLFTALELRKAVTLQFRYQKNGEKKLFGEICIELGLITEAQRDEVLNAQETIEVIPEATVFGYLAIVNGFVNKEKINEGLKIQKEMREKGEKKRIGEILHSRKLMAPIQIHAILKAYIHCRNIAVIQTWELKTQTQKKLLKS